MKRRGVLLLNFGGPATVQEVRQFLRELFMVPEILPGLPAFLRFVVSRGIACLRGGHSERLYAAIGGGSPIRRWTEAQAALLRTVSGLAVETGMRVGTPSIREGLHKLRAQGVEELVLLPLFPQFSTTTSGACLSEVGRQLRSLGWSPVTREIPGWPVRKEYVEFMRGGILCALAAAAPEKAYVLFSAHSLPLSVIERGDPYPDEVKDTVQTLARGLPEELCSGWSLAWQSRGGPGRWLAPSLGEEVRRLGATGVRALVVVPVSFVSDHVETLWELDLECAEAARNSGVARFFRVPVLNDAPEAGELLAGLVRAAVGENS